SDYRCPEHDCWLEVNLENISLDVFSHDLASNLRKLWLHLFRIFGGRRAVVRVRAVGLNGVVWLIFYDVEIETFSQSVKEDDASSTLSGEALSTARFYIVNDGEGLTL